MHIECNDYGGIIKDSFCAMSVVSYISVYIFSMGGSKEEIPRLSHTSMVALMDALGIKLIGYEYSLICHILHLC